MRHAARPLPLLLILTLASPCLSRTWHILPDGSGDAPTIQAGVDSASTGDVVELAPGEYMGDGNQDVDFLGKAITIRSENLDPTEVIIRPGHPYVCHHGFIFQSGEGRASLLEAVTLRGAVTPYMCFGGAVLSEDSSPTIRGCHFVDCWSIDSNPCVALIGGSPYITECFFSSNSIEEGGGAAILCAATALIESCIFEGNGGGGVGGAMTSSANTVIRDCLFLHNSAGREGGAIYGAGIIERCVFDGNSSWLSGGAIYATADSWISECTFISNRCRCANAGSGIYVRPEANVSIDRTIVAFGELVATAIGGEPALTCCDIFGNVGGDWTPNIASQLGINGNFSADPMFCGDENPEDPYTLFSSSPCFPGHHPQGCDCGVIGARGAGCQAIRTSLQTWARVKARYR
jgi:predicted outer membrane repeat protein